MKKFIIILSALVCSGAYADDRLSVYDFVVEGKECKEGYGQTITCTYKVGNSLSVSIIGLGDQDAAITFFKADFDGDFYASYGLGHGCVIVKAGRDNPRPATEKRFAFIQPNTGKVYKTWEDCKAGY